MSFDDGSFYGVLRKARYCKYGLWYGLLEAGSCWQHFRKDCSEGQETKKVVGSVRLSRI